MTESPFNEAIVKDLSLDLIAKQVVEGFITGLHKSPFHGFSVEFAEHRLYNQGESIRSIDWKLFARSEKLFVKKYEEETNLRCQIAIDRSSSMYFPLENHRSLAHKFNKIYFSAVASASLLYLLQRQRDSFGLSIFSDQVEKNIPSKATYTHFKLLLAELENSVSTRPTSSRTQTAECLHILAESFHKRSLIVIFSDLLDISENAEKFEAFFSALGHLKYNKHEIILFHVVDYSKEIEFDFKNQPYWFIDLESGKHIKANPTKVRDQYQKFMNKFRDTIKDRCGRNGIDYVLADIENGYDSVLNSYLLRRTKMNI